MKKKNFAAILSALAIISAGTVTVSADEILSKEEIISEIWEDRWFGDGDDGTQFPEASFNHHLIEAWVNDNYDNDEDYDWSDIGRLKYQYGDYYSDLTGEWLYTDEDGKWYITDPENDKFYHFTMFQGEWNMIDSNGDTVDTFKPFSTLEDNEHPTVPADNSTGDSSGKVVPENADAAHRKASEWTADKADMVVTATVQAENTEAVSSSDNKAKQEQKDSKKMTFYRVMAAAITVFGGAVIIKKVRDGRKDA